MPVYVSPGVYIREIDLSLYAPQISTCILASLGTATKGPVNKAIYVSTHTQFIREFGNPHSDHLATLAHLQFLAKGNQSYFTRVTDGTETNAACPIYGAASPATVIGTEMGPFNIADASYATIAGLAAGTYNITAARTYKWDGGNASANTATLLAIADAKFQLTYTDRWGVSTAHQIDAMNLTAASPADEDGIAAIIQARIRTVTGLDHHFVWDTDHYHFESSVSDLEYGSNIATAWAASTSGGTDIHGASHLVIDSGTGSGGDDGNNVLLIAADGGAAQYVELPAGAGQSAADLADDIRSQTSGITAVERVEGTLYYIDIKSETIGSSGSIELVALPDTMEAYTDVMGAVTIGTPVTGGDGETLLEYWALPWGAYRTGQVANNFNNLVAVTDGSMTVNLDGDGNRAITGIDLSSATTWTEICTILETAINNAPWTGNQKCKVTYSYPYVSLISFDDITPTMGTASTMYVDVNYTGTNLMATGLLTPATAGPGPNDGFDMFSIHIPSGTSVTADLIVSSIMSDPSGTRLWAYNDNGYLKLTTQRIGGHTYLKFESTSTALDVLGIDTDVHWGTGTEDPTFTLYAPTPGTDGNNLSAVVSEGYQKTLHEQWVTDNPGELEEDSPYYEYREAFKIDLYYSDIRIGSYDNLTVNDQTYDSYIETQLGTLSSDYNPARLVVAEDAETGSYPEYGTYEFGATTATEGSDGNSSLVDADYIGVVADPSGKPTGMQVYGNAETFDMNLLIVPGVSSTNVQTAMILLCEARADAMCILDPPFGLPGPQYAVDWSNKQGSYGPGQAINSSYAAIYWPWIKVYDAVNAEEVWTPPSGHAAAVYAYTDYISEPWFAPAGYNRAHIVAGIDLEMSPSQGDRDLMYGYPNVVNPIVNFFPDGITIWGQKTTQRKPSATDRVNVRRLLLYARKLVATVVRYLVFEPNDAVTWRWFVALCTPIFENIQRRRGVYEFRVVCDETTNPPDQIDRNEMNGRIYLKPTKAAEVITVDFVITTTGANFDEIEY